MPELKTNPVMNPTLVDWLMTIGGPAIRYRTARVLLPDCDDVDLELLASELLTSPKVSLWLERLGGTTELDQLHSSKATAYENAMGKLVQLGCHQGIPAFDAKTAYYRDWLGSCIISDQNNWLPFKRILVGSFLAAAGYHDDLAVQDYLANRLETLWRFSRHKDFDIYADRDQYPDIPKGFRDKPLVKPELYSAAENPLPLIYDMVAFANFQAHLRDEVAQRKINSVIEYVLHPNYQAFPEGYGLMRAGRRRYYAIGWSVHLPGYKPGSEKQQDENRLIQRLVLMSKYPAARMHPWFQESLTKLENFRTDRGTYVFPRSYLNEHLSGYWVTGAYMGLEENRRSNLAIELESTFWMLLIKKNAIAMK